MAERGWRFDQSNARPMAKRFKPGDKVERPIYRCPMLPMTSRDPEDYKLGLWWQPGEVIADHGFEVYVWFEGENSVTSSEYDRLRRAHDPP